MAETFSHLSAVLGLTVGLAFLLRKLKQPLVVAYIAGGVIAGPLVLNIVNSEDAFFETLAHFGIVLLLFVIGLNFSFAYLQRLGKNLLIGGVAQFLLTVAAGLVVLKMFGFGWQSAVFVGTALAFSSTIIVVKLLTEKRETETSYGQFVIGVLVVQDVLAVILLIVLNALGLSGSWQSVALQVLGKSLVLGGVLYFVAKHWLPDLINRAARSGELLFIFTLAWCFGVASIVEWAGFGAELGAVIAGITLGSSPFQAEISSRLRPLRDFFIVLFFLVLGSSLQLHEIASVWVMGLALAVFVLVIEPIILYWIMRRLGYKRRNAFLASVTAAQVSEFGFILMYKGKELGYLPGPELGLLTMVALLTIMISSYLVTYNEQLWTWFKPWLEKFGKENVEVKSIEPKEYNVWIFGYHRMGWRIAEALRRHKIPFAVVDFNPQAMEKLAVANVPAYFGDASDVEFLSDLPLGDAELIVSTLPDASDQLALVHHIRRQSEEPIIICHLQHARHLEDLYNAGADYVVLTHLLGGQWVADRLPNTLTHRNLAALRREQERELRLRHALNLVD